MTAAVSTLRSPRHYERAVEDFLRLRKVPYLAMDESRRVIVAGARIKSFDFLIYSPKGSKLIADVKGRKFPYGEGAGRRYWENWISRWDLDGLREWQRAFGEAYRAVLIFAYLLSGESHRWPEGPIHSVGGLK